MKLRNLHPSVGALLLCTSSILCSCQGGDDPLGGKGPNSRSVPTQTPTATPTQTPTDDDKNPDDILRMSEPRVGVHSDIQVLDDLIFETEQGEPIDARYLPSTDGSPDLTVRGGRSPK